MVVQRCAPCAGWFVERLQMRVLSAEDVPVDDGLTVTRWRRYGKDRLYVTVASARVVYDRPGDDDGRAVDV